MNISLNRTYDGKFTNHPENKRYFKTNVEKSYARYRMVNNKNEE